jgi:hypothetical protein
MAIVQRTVQVQSDFANANWTKNKLIDALETVFADAGLHGAAVTGQVKGWDDGITQYTYYSASDPAQCSGGGSLPASLANTNDPASTNTTDFRYKTFRNLPATGGSGTGATFDVKYNNGTLYRVMPANPGSGYTNGDVLTISAASILGTSNGAADVSVTVKVDTTNYGGTSNFFQKNSVQTSTRPWAILKVDNDPTKKYGSTYYFFQVISDTTLQVTSGFNWSGWNQQFAGAYRMETWESHQETSWTLGDYRKDDQNAHYNSNYDTDIVFSTTTSYPLYIKTAQAQSPQDSNFAIFSFAQTDIPSTDHMNDLYYGSFSIPKYTTSIYNNDHVGHLGIVVWTNGTSTNATFQQAYNVTMGNSQGLPRCAEQGWAERITNNPGYYNPTFYQNWCNYTWRSHKNADNTTNPRLYYQQVSDYPYDEHNSDNDYQGQTTSLPYQAAGGYVVDASVEYKSVIKGIPINPFLLPSPYTIPDDFVVLEIMYGTPSAKFLPGDTITVSGSEAYTILVGGYNNTDNDETIGIFFCGRVI